MAQVHYHINHSAMRIAYIATVAITTGVKTQTWMPIVVPRATALMVLYMQSQSLSYHLYGSAI
jgi:hypothetical protein